MADLEVSMGVAGRGAALQKRRCRFTPFDALIFQMEAERRSTSSHRQARKTLTWWITAARRRRTRWRLEQDMKQASEQKKNYFKNVSQTGSPSSWHINHPSTAGGIREIFGGYSDTTSQDQGDLLVGQNSIEDLIRTVFDGEADDFFDTTHVEFSEMLSRVPLGKAGGQDGVPSEFVRALSAGHQADLWDRITAMLHAYTKDPSTSSTS